MSNNIQRVGGYEGREIFFDFEKDQWIIQDVNLGKIIVHYNELLDGKRPVLHP